MTHKRNFADERPLKILFVCSGNTCRSPLAEILARNLHAEKELLPPVVFSSAGLSAINGEAASLGALQVAEEMGYSLQDHHARKTDSGMLREADLILTMTNSQRNLLLLNDNSHIAKTFVLNRYVGQEPADIGDPYGSSIEVYRRTAAQLQNSIRALLEKLEQSLARR